MYVHMYMGGLYRRKMIRSQNLRVHRYSSASSSSISAVANHRAS